MALIILSSYGDVDLADNEKAFTLLDCLYEDLQEATKQAVEYLDGNSVDDCPKAPSKPVIDWEQGEQMIFSKDDISNNLIECFNKQFKAWYKTKQSFSNLQSANNLISMFIFFFNFVRPHSALNGLTPAQVAGLNLSIKQKHKFLIVS